MIALIVALVVLGVALYLVETYVPMAPPFKIAIRAVVVLFLLVYAWRVLFGGADLTFPRP
jgi:hypothetical protein